MVTVFGNSVTHMYFLKPNTISAQHSNFENYELTSIRTFCCNIILDAYFTIYQKAIVKLDLINIYISHSPDVVPSDFYLFSNLLEYLCGYLTEMMK